MPVSERFLGANVIDAGRLSPYWGEHAARYRYALPFVEGKTVLDIACGTGYGIGIMKPVAKFVAGLDRDADGIASAHEECDERSSVLLGDGLKLPFDDGAFQVATSFETIEHLHDREGFLAELQRILEPDGMLLLSTPNANYTMPIDGIPSNPFHVHEYRPQELRETLERFFVVEGFMGQSLDPSIKIPPFFDAQRRLPCDLSTQSRLFSWKVFNKLPFRLRESLSIAIWGKPFYPTEADYVFSSESVDQAPVTFAICRRK